ncbi:MAG: hypothetical protein AAF500_07525 [Myxococcota bacterium]
MKFIAVLSAVAMLNVSTAVAQDASTDTDSQVVSGVPSDGSASAPSPAPEDCKPVNTGGPIAGIVVASIFWYVLPMSIPVLITQSKKLKRRKAEKYAQAQRGCPVVP